MEHAEASDDTGRHDRRFLLVVLFLAALVVNVQEQGISRLLARAARDLGIDLRGMSLLLTLDNVSSLFPVIVAQVAVAPLAGFASDRFRRGPILMGSLVVLALSPLIFLMTGLHVVVVVGLVVGWNACMGTVFAALSDEFSSAERGRPFGILLTAPSLAYATGVLPVAYAMHYFGWPGVLGGLAVLLLVLAVLIWNALVRGGNRTAVGASRTRRLTARAIFRLLTPRVRVLFMACATGQFVYGGVSVYPASFLLYSYSATFEEVQVGLITMACGTLLGNVVGGVLADRVASRWRLVYLSLVSMGVLAPTFLIWQPGLIVTTMLGVAYTFGGALGRPALLALVSDVSADARGTLLGLSTTFGHVGWLASTAIGGLLVTSYGFGVPGWSMALVSLIGATLVWRMAPPEMPETLAAEA